MGWFGGHGFKGTMKYFTDSGIPAVFAFLAITAEFLGPIGLAVGLLTRIAAFGIACVMLGHHNSALAARLFYQLVRQPKR